MRKLFIILAAIISVSSLWAQNSDENTPIQGDGTGRVFIIQEVHFITDKYTRESALERELSIKPGTEFDSREELEEYLEDKAQHLRNLRVLEEVTYRYEELEDLEGKEARVLIVYEVIGAWTIYPIVYPKYDSNTGWRVGGQIYYDNFFGTLTKFYLGGNVDFQHNGDEWEIPQWSLNPRISNLTIGDFTFDLELTQQYYQVTKYNSDDEYYEQDYSLHSTSLDMGSKINLPWDLSYSFGPSFQWYYGYKDNLEDEGSDIEKEDLEFSFSHSAGYSTIDWIGNFRQGVSASLGHTIALATELEEDVTFKTSLSYSAKAFYIWKRLNPSARISGMYSFNEEKTGLGSSLRGIRDEDMYGFASVNLNTSVNISVIPWEGVGEALCQPFFDVGVAFKEDEAWDWDRDFKYSAGADFILYLDALKSLVARGAIGIDLTNPDWSDSRKYEIQIESSLHY